MQRIPKQAAAHRIIDEAVVHDVLPAARPTRCSVTVQEIAALTLLLAAEQVGSIAGAIIRIDGGWTAH